MTKKLRITLYITGAHQAAFGSMVVFAPAVFQRITQTTLTDPRITLLYGSYLLIFSCVSFMAAREKEAASKLSLTVLLVVAANCLVFGSLLLTGMETFARVGPVFLINAVLTSLVFLFRRQPRVVGQL